MKTASLLIREYGELENIINNTKNMKSRLAELIESNIELLRKNYQIIDLQNHFIDENKIQYLEFEKTILTTMQILQKIS